MATDAPVVIKRGRGRPRKPIKIGELSKDDKFMLTYPDVFCEVVLGFKGLYPKQKEILRAFHPSNARCTVRTCNESGKTSKLVTGLILWHGCLFPGGLVTSTSGSWGQVINQLVPNLKAQRVRFPEWEFNDTSIRRKNGQPVWIGYSTNDPGKAEGFHGSDDAPLMALVDECKTVPDENLEAIDRCNPQRTGYFSSPGYAEGGFYRSHTKEKELWRAWKIAADECPHISKESIERRIKKYGADHQLVRSMIYAEFMEMVQDAILSLKELENCVDHPPLPVFGTRRAFCDFAAGGDENVLAVKVGNRVWIEDAWHEKNTMSAVGRFITGFQRLKNKYGLHESEIEGDADGLGLPMIQAIQEAGWKIGEYHANSAPLHDNNYANRSAETWFMGAKAIKDCKVILQNDEELFAQMMSRKSRYNSKGRLAVESKEDMRKRGVESPDRADAVLGALVGGPMQNSISTDNRLGWGRIKSDPFIELDDVEIEEGVLAGINANL